MFSWIEKFDIIKTKFCQQEGEMGICIHIGEMLARNARMYPDEIALVERWVETGKRREITWKEFDRMANKFANALLKRGVVKGDKVLHIMMNSIDWLIAYFGVIKTGAWVVPLNFRFSSEEIKYCIDVSEPKVVIFGPEFTERIEAIKDECPTVRHYVFVGEGERPSWAESFEDFIEGVSEDEPSVEISYEDEAALYFTSGTTGRPKPILLTHKNLSASAIYESVRQKAKHTDCFLLIPPLYHTGAKMHWFGHFIVGGKGVLLRGISPQGIFEAISQEGVTVVFLLVPWANDILLALDSGDLKLDQYELSRWRLMYIGAQPVPPSLVKRWKEYFPKMAYHTVYGLSEATGPGCLYLPEEYEHKIGSIGLPGFNWEARIVDEAGQPVKRGEIGELVVRGDGVMKCYYKNPEATSQAIRNGWLHTGDMARQDEDGFFWLVDRKKDIIIVGGENVFPVEVEEFLHTHPKIKDVAAIGYPDPRLGEVVAVVIELKPGETMTEEEVFKFCEVLPRYKRPRKVFFGNVPRNPTGKIEKPKLRQKYIGTEAAFKVE
jgi:acyl-CoA synthetase (AMP-forming)/AMP-acid ligase II